jgi:hypothetical protein
MKWRWLLGCCVLGVACGGASRPHVASRGKARPVPAASGSSRAVAASWEPISVTLGAAPLAFDKVRIERSPEIPLQVTPRGQTYGLPLARNALVNLERDILGKGLVSLGSPELARLLERGSVIAPSDGLRRFDEAYALLKNRNIPILVSADSVLHQQHILFNEILKAVEQRSLAPMLGALLEGLYRELLPELERPVVSEAALNELLVLAVARRALDPSTETHPALAERAKLELLLIATHAGVHFSYAQSDRLCVTSNGRSGRCYEEDFSQYVPRGHYTVSQELSRYFRAMMWLGRMGRRLKHDAELAQQILLVEAAKRAQCTLAGQSVPAAVLLSRMDQLLELFVGVSDDLTLPEVDGVLRAKLGVEKELLVTSEVLQGLRQELVKLRAPRILSGTIAAYGADAAATTKDETQGLRLLGQRFAPDSETLGRLVFEHVGPDVEHVRFAEVARDAASNARGDYCDGLPAELRRALPQLTRANVSPHASRCICERAVNLWRGAGAPRAGESRNRELTQVCRLMPSVLDVASVMGSALAERYLQPSKRYAGYEQQLGELRAAHRAARLAPPTNLYQEWLAAVEPLLSPMPADYPTWMSGVDYQKKSLRTFAASWTELRHDTILYVKQSYTAGRALRVGASGGGLMLEPEAYGVVEARPDLYRRLKSLTAQTRATLRALDALPAEVDGSLAAMDAVLERLTQISIEQLEGRALGKEDQRYIKSIGEQLLRISLQVTRALTPPPAPPAAGSDHRTYLTSETQGLDEVLAVPLVADVHTDPHTRRVLEEGTGPLEWLLAVTRMPDGSLSVAVGPIFSYKEFVHPMRDRLTNERWRGAMKAGANIPPPLWWSSDRPIANGFQVPPFAQPP